MNLKDLLPSKDNPPELYWALVIERGFVQSGIWYINEGKSEVLGIGAGIPWKSDEELIEATDATLSSAIQKLPEDYPEPQKTVFGVSTSWVEDGEISSENLTKIKKLCGELSLTPAGFVVLPEAIAHYYKSEEGAPLNAIILKSDEESLELSIFKLGELVGSTEVSRSVSLVDDVIEGLSRFDGVAPLPTRFIIYDGKEGILEEIKQTLIQADWSVGKINFLHAPQIEVLEIDKKVLATALAGGAEMGNATEVAEVQNEASDENTAGTEQTEEIKKEPLPAEAVGFAVGEDISSYKKEDLQNVTPIEKTPQTLATPVIKTQAGLSFAKTASNYFSKSKNLFHSLTRVFPKGRTEQGNKMKIIYTILIALVFGTIGVLILWWFVQTAKITIFVTPKRYEENVETVFSVSGKFDQENSIIPASTLSTKVFGEKTKSTTGTKLIGNKAAGSVQIANGNSAAINLSPGTVLTSAGGYKFVLDSEASVSGQLLPGSPGTATVNVTAYDIGSSYNLAKGEVFSVGNYSKALVAATSAGDFNGGSSQEISAVGKEDQTALEEDLKNELKQNALSDLSAKVEEDKYFVNDLADFSVASANFDHKIGDEAGNLKLSLTMDAIGLAAGKEDLLKFAKGLMDGKSPSGYSLSSDQIDFKFTFLEKTEDGYKYSSVIGGNFLPVVDTEKIKNAVQGKTKEAATVYLNSIPGFDRANVDLGVRLPGFLKTIPRISKHISVEIKPE